VAGSVSHFSQPVSQPGALKPRGIDWRLGSLSPASSRPKNCRYTCTDVETGPLASDDRLNAPLFPLVQHLLSVCVCVCVRRTTDSSTWSSIAEFCDSRVDKFQDSVKKTSYGEKQFFRDNH
jgi:hypothetical protein